MKLTKDQSKKHKQAMDLVHSDKLLAYEEKLFIIKNYQESQGQLNALAGAFFTPYGMARDFSIEVGYSTGKYSVIDLCAGIGILSFACYKPESEITCVEKCAEYVTIGKRVLPEADWINADVFQITGKFDFAISNPPFGSIKETTFYGKYTGSNFEYKVIEQASRLADYGVFILPQMSAPFKYSGQRQYEENKTQQYVKFTEQTGIELTANCGIDTSMYINDWNGVSPMCEIVCCDFENVKQQVALF